MSTINFNGKVYQGNNITISNNRVYVDGKEVTDPESAKQINIFVSGNVSQLTVDSCEKVGVNGDVGSIKTQSGDVVCQNVSGSVSTMSGDVECGPVNGSVSTMSGKIRHK